MTQTLLVKDRPYMLDFYLPLDKRARLDNGTELHVQLTLTPYEIVAQTKFAESLAELIVDGTAGLYRYTAMFPNHDWRQLDIYNTVALQRESLETVADLHNVKIQYVGPVVKHYLSYKDTRPVGDELPIFDQYFDPEDFQSWQLGTESTDHGKPLFIPFCTERAYA